MWDILKHEKDQYVYFIKDITYINEASDELSLHHDNSINAATKNSAAHNWLSLFLIYVW